MAKLSSSDAPVARTTRSTRSQSREPSAQPAETSGAVVKKKRGGRKGAVELATVAEQATNEAGDEDPLQADALAAHQEATSAAVEAQRQRQSLVNLTSMQQLADTNAISKLKARKRLSGVAAPPQTAPEAHMAMDPRLTKGQKASTAYDDGYVQLEDDVDVQPTAQETAVSAMHHLSGHLAGFHEQQKQHAKRAKSKSFIERQDTATRVEFDSQPMQNDYQHGGVPNRSSAPGPYHVRPASSPNKRPYADVDDEGMQEFDPTQDQGFQTDMRDTTAADQRRRTAQAKAQRPRAQPSERADTVEYEIPGSSAYQQASVLSPRKNPGSALPGPIAALDPNDPPLARSQYYEHAKIAAKLSRVDNKLGQAPQVRKPWSPTEEEKLIGLIETHGGQGVSYAVLKKWDASEGGVLAGRSAEDLRFKARNMKLTILLAKVDLPENFQHVVLDRKAMEKLSARNIPYVQQRIRGGAEVNEDA